MRRLRRTTNRIDTLRTEARPRKRGRVGRYVYLLLLVGLALSLFDVLAGDLVYLRAEGMVTQDVAIAAPEYPGTVVSLDVDPGDSVKEGETVAVVRSHKILKDIAELAAQVATTEARLSDLRIRRHKLATLIPAARERHEASASWRERVSTLRDSGLATGKQDASAMADAYSALQDLKDLEAEAELVDAEFAKLRDSAARAAEALKTLESLYRDGVVAAPESGLVGTVRVARGEGVKEGQRLAEIFHGPRFVLAYVPVGALYGVAPDDEVVLRFGFRTLEGRIESRLPVAYRLPDEFQRQFQTLERRQLIRVGITDDAVPPLFTEVEVTRPGAIRALLARAANFIVGAPRAALADHAGP